MPSASAFSDRSHERQTEDSSGTEIHTHSPPLDADDLDGDSETAGHANGWIVKAGLLGASSSASFIRSICKAVDGDETPKTEKAVPERRASRNPVQGKRIRSSSIYSAEYVLPPRKVADRLLDLHWKHSHIPWIDRLRFLGWYEGLWAGNENPKPDVDEQVYYCMMNIAFALAYKEDPTVSPDDQEALSESHFIRAQKLLCFNLLDITYIGLVQALLLMGQYLQSTNMTRQCFQCVGLAILVAQNLRLHIPQTISAIRSQHDREMARRAWHGCILMDRITSMTFGQPIRISQDVARQAPFPAAIDDEYLHDGDSEGTQPIGIPSKLNFYVAFCKLHIILGDILSTFHHGPAPLSHGSSVESDALAVKHDIDKIIEFDKALSTWHENLESELQITADGIADSKFRGQAVNLYARFLHIRMLLYRPFFSQSSETLRHSVLDHKATRAPRFADTITFQGLLTCVNAAQQILALFSSTIEGGSEVERMPPWWHVISYVYTAVTIVIAAQIFPSVVEQVSISGLTASIQQGFRILEQYESSQSSARRCKAALTALYEKITSSKEEKFTPNGTLVPPDPNTIYNFDIELPADFAWDAVASDFFGDSEMRWLDGAPFDPDNNAWL